MTEQHLPVRDRNYIVMKHTKVDDLRMLLSKNTLLWIHLIQASYRLAGFTGLTRRIAGRSRIAALLRP